jgi:hypothetical protein
VIYILDDIVIFADLLDDTSRQNSPTRSLYHFVYRDYAKVAAYTAALPQQLPAYRALHEPQHRRLACLKCCEPPHEMRLVAEKRR